MTVQRSILLQLLVTAAFLCCAPNASAQRWAPVVSEVSQEQQAEFKGTGSRVSSHATVSLQTVAGENVAEETVAPPAITISHSLSSENLAAASCECGEEKASCCSANHCNSCCGCGKSGKAAKANPCAKSHKGLFFNNNFSYLNDPSYGGCCLGDSLKLRPLGECGKYGTVDIGGQLRLRYHHEKGMAQNPGLTRFQDNSNDFLLTRMRLYTDWKINEWARFYAEGIYAGLDGPADYVPRVIDQNYGDLLNIFFDIALTGNTTVRLGRQELLYGAQRTVSPLDWANTRRTFEGINIMYREGDLAVDGFLTNFVPPLAHRFDEGNPDLTFYGMYGVYNGLSNATLDFYYLGFDNQINGPGIVTDFSLHTVGLRLNGSYCDWLYEVEGAPQFGRQSGLGLDHVGGFATAGIGRKLTGMPWGATLWFYYDYASGNNIGGDFNRYNQLFPLAHKYLGFIDATARSNIESPNLLLTMKPTEKVNLLFWYYHLMANQDTDVVRSIGGTPNQSTASKDWGDELDIVAKYTFGPRSNILFGWSHFWRGNKIVTPNPADADFFYSQWTLNF